MLAALASVYPVFILAFTWSHVSKSVFPGGRDGQLDAYRHALASATVSYTLGEWAVNVVTWIFESENKASSRMDRHNNRIGASIGSRAKSFQEIQPGVLKAVANGTVNAQDRDQITWLPEAQWRAGKLW